MAIEKTQEGAEHLVQSSWGWCLSVFFNLQVAKTFSMKLQILHIANSSLWITILILMAFFYTPSKSSPSDCLFLTIVSELSVSAVFTRYWSFSYQGRDSAPTGQLCSCEKPWPGISPSLLSGSAFELRSGPWSLPELCYRDTVPSPIITSTLTCWLGPLYWPQTRFIDRAGVANTGPLATGFVVLAPHRSSHSDAVHLCPCQWVTASAVLVMLGPGSPSLAEQLALISSWHVCRKLPTRAN